ncbi:MAG: roadblock/LC7 domain-containing protein [Armatimonadota bacterium]|jgi:predicted regulator of Ras-like GTPase activity (Roadblock/LC7/MglB family)|nr:roadblock/LC7 domain-containing protein [Armatimonadota bacterium]
MSQLKDVLMDLSKVEGVLAALVVARDGFVVEGLATDESVDLEAVGAIVASNIAASDSMGREMARGGMRNILIEFDEGPVAIGPAGPDAVLVVVGSRQANLGRIRLEMRRNSQLAAALV